MSGEKANIQGAAIIPSKSAPQVFVQSPWSLLAVLYISYRVALANLAPITDCDEVYNYWEPLHFMIHKSGFQTWEYSKEYGLRTYMYLMPLYLIHQTIQTFMVIDKRVAFGILRGVLGGATGMCEVLFIKAVSQKFGAFVGVSTLLSLAASPGMFHASGALLPSATVMQLVMLSLSQSLLVAPTPSPESKNGARGSETLAIFYGLIATLCVGWPFSAALFIPLGLQAIYRAWSRPTGKVASVLGLLSRTALHAILVQCVVTLVDHNFYNTVIFPSWNILRYNVMQGDDELYGVEPFSYYVKNLLLNFNVVAVMAFIAIPLLLLELALHQTHQKVTFEKLYALSPMVIWLLLVGSRPHKEERFLFPIFPFLALASSFALELIASGVSLIASPYSESHVRTNMKHVLAFFVFALVMMLSAGRIMALHFYYVAPMQIYNLLYSVIADARLPRPLRRTNHTVAICVSGEWYRFPSSFMLPSGTKLEFLPSGFKGQLPQPFTELGSAVDPHDLPQPFNDVNREEVTRYILGGVVECDYVVDLILEPTKTRGESDGSRHMRHPETASWSEVGAFSFLDAERTGILRRTMFLPKWVGNIGGPARYADYSAFRQMKEEKDLDTLPKMVKRIRESMAEDET
jgi:alpha-1,2-mannosyltransferase